MTSRRTEKTRSTLPDRVSTTWKLRPPATKSTRRLSGSQTGVNGTNGLDGASVTFVGYFTGNQNGCPNGGTIYAVGSPAVQTYVCHGSNGADGTGGTRTDGPCFDDVNRYVDCGNGTVADAVTGLVWLNQADCLAPTTWAAAIGPQPGSRTEIAA
jgi:hypothetical protein